MNMRTQLMTFQKFCLIGVFYLISIVFAIIFIILIQFDNSNNHIVSKIIKPIPALSLSISALLSGLISLKQSHWAFIRLSMVSSSLFVYALGDICLSVDNFIVTIVGVVLFFIGNIVIGLSLIFGQKLSDLKKTTCFRFLIIILVVAITSIISIITAVMLRMVFKTSVLISIGCFVYMISHIVLRFFLVLIPYPISSEIIGCLGSVVYQISDVLIFIHMFGDEAEESSHNQTIESIYMSMYYCGIIVICYGLMVANLPKIVRQTEKSIHQKWKITV